MFPSAGLLKFYHRHSQMFGLCCFRIQEMRRGPFKFSFFLKPKPVDFHFFRLWKRRKKTHNKKMEVDEMAPLDVLARTPNKSKHAHHTPRMGLLVFFLQSIGDNVNVYKTGIRTFCFKLCVSIIYVTYIFFIPHYTHTHLCKNA